MTMERDPSGRSAMIAACGINCDECPIRRAAADPGYAEELAEQWRRSHEPEASADWFTCQGCHGPKHLVWTGDCEIRACCVDDKGLANCSLCDEFPCPRIDRFAGDGYPHHAEAVRTLTRMREDAGDGA